MPTLFETISTDPQFSLLADLIELVDAQTGAGLADALNTPGLNATIFAPTNDAILSVANDLGYPDTSVRDASGYIEASLNAFTDGASGPLLAQILSYHVVGSLVSEADLADPGTTSLTTLALDGGTPLDVGVSNGALVDLDADSPDANVGTLNAASNGNLYAIDSLLIPTELTTDTVFTPNADIFEGDDEADVVNLLEGDDVAGTRGGDDTVIGGLGEDLIYTADGNDTVWGDNEFDLVNGDDDTIRTGKGDDTVNGGGGDDYIDGQAGADLLFGDDGEDIISGGAGDDLVFGGNGNDYLTGNSGNDVVSGDDGDDTILGRAGDDDLNGGDGDDLMLGDFGMDYMVGGRGEDTMFGGNENDELLGGAQNDRLFGDANDDFLNGGDGNDTVAGNSGNDIIKGGNGNDFIKGGRGDDILEGGFGDDTFDFRVIKEQVSNDTILDFDSDGDTDGDQDLIKFYGVTTEDLIFTAGEGDDLGHLIITTELNENFSLKIENTESLEEGVDFLTFA